MIYSVEDDVQIREMILYALKQSGLEARGFGDAEAFWAAVAAEKPSLVLLDIMLPAQDGLSILRGLRSRADTAALPVILLSAKGSEAEKVSGLNLGADDYITKPFSVLELIARVSALLRRTGREGSGRALVAEGIHLDVDRHAVTVEGEPVLLTPKEFELLQYLMRHPGVACSRERLLGAVWDAQYAGNTRTVDVHIQTLRQKLGAAGEAVETVRGLGYRLRGTKG